jgi:hypothetical protein
MVLEMELQCVDELLCVICMNITIARVEKATAVSCLGERMEDTKDSKTVPACLYTSVVVSNFSCVF